jgi:hypothetical protein
VTVASFVAACGSSAASGGSDAGAVRWTASAETEAALGVQTWRLERTPEKAALSGSSRDGATVFHGVLGRSADRIYVDVEKPDAWHLDYERGALPVASGPVPLQPDPRPLTASGRCSAARERGVVPPRQYSVAT